jgi:site-specific DNA-methyltransferase (cytosine-N4-specific)
MIGYKTTLGSCIAGDSLELLKTLDDNSINLTITSPPFALLRQKSYGNKEQSAYVSWLCSFGKLVYSKLTPDGSFVIDLGGAYNRGNPTYSLYQFRVLIQMCDEIGFHLAQPFYWHNPSALPSPIEWVNKRKLRAKNSVNTVWWLSKTEWPKANVKNVLVPYSSRMKHLITKPEDFIKKEHTERPSGHVMVKTSWAKDNGGAIPPNLLQYSNSESNSQYLRYCKALSIKGHPARFPLSLPEFFIKFLTDEYDTVVDIFGGSNTTGQAAENLNRHWLTYELSKEYVAASSFRFSESIEQAKKYYDAIINGEFLEIASPQMPDLFLDNKISRINH